MRKLIVPKFIDHHPQFSANGFIATNEEPALFNKILGNVAVKRAAGIASGGEMILSVLLPRAEEVVAVDHSYRALAASLVKILLVQKFSAKRIANLLFEEKYDEISALVATLSKELPEPLREKAIITATDRYNLREVRKGWLNMQVPPRLTQQLDKLTFLHGDLTDLPGQFDMLYVSNAMEHSNREHKYLTLEDLEKYVNPGGYVLFSSNGEYYGYKRAHERKFFERVGNIYGVSTNWDHIVLQKR